MWLKHGDSSRRWGCRGEVGSRASLRRLRWLGGCWLFLTPRQMGAMGGCGAEEGCDLA